MQLQSYLWIEGPYHVDFSPRGELRIVGRGDHLYLGLAGVAKKDLQVDSVALRGTRLLVVGRFHSSGVRLLDPIVSPVRKIRSLTEGKGRTPSYEELVRKQYRSVAPDEIKFEIEAGRPAISYRRRYGDQWYGSRILLTPETRVSRLESEHSFELKADQSIAFEIIAESSFPAPPPVRALLRPGVIDLGKFRDRADFIKHLLD